MANMYLIYLQQTVMQSAKSRVKFGGSESADTLTAAVAKPSKCHYAPLQRSVLERDESNKKKKKKVRFECGSVRGQ